MTQLPNPFLSDLSELHDISESVPSGTDLAAMSGFAHMPHVAAGPVSVSDDVISSSLPSPGESEPSVMPVYASSESLSPGVLAGSLVKIEADPSVTLDCALGENSSCGSTESRSAVDPDAERMRQGLDGADGCIDPMHVVPRTIAGVASGPQETFSPDDTCHIGEIFAYARKLAREDRQVDRIPDPETLWPILQRAVIAENHRIIDSEPMPLFLRMTI